MKRGQISIEYLIVIGFVVFVVIALLGISFYYVSSIRDTLRLNQIEGFANKIISNSETVFFAGEPSKATITAFLPAGVNSISVFSNELVLDINTDSGVVVIGYASDVPISIPGGISASEGLKKIEIEAFETVVIITQI